MNCSQCGNELDQGAAFCGNCGAQIAAQPAPSVSQPPVTQPPVAPQPPQFQQPSPQPAYSAPIIASAAQPQPPLPPQPVMPIAPQPAAVVAASVAQPQSVNTVPAYAVPHGNSSAKPIVGLVIGILAPLLCLIPIVGFVLGIVAIVLGSLSLKLKKGMAIAAIVLGAIGVVLAILLWIGFIMMSAADASSLSGYLGVPL